MDIQKGLLEKYEMGRFVPAYIEPRDRIKIGRTVAHAGQPVTCYKEFETFTGTTVAFLLQSAYVRRTDDPDRLEVVSLRNLYTPDGNPYRPTSLEEHINRTGNYTTAYLNPNNPIRRKGRTP